MNVKLLSNLSLFYGAVTLTFIATRKLLKFFGIIPSKDVIFFDGSLSCSCNEFTDKNYVAKCNNKYCRERGLNKLVSIIGSAKKSLDICMYTFDENRIMEKVLQLAEERLNIRLVYDHNAMQWDETYINSLKQAGIDTRSVKEEVIHMHNKYCIVDSKTVITGSANWNKNSFMYNHESIIVTTDSKLANIYKHFFEEMWKDFAFQNFN